MKPVKLISFTEETVMASYPNSSELRFVDLTKDVDFAEDSRMVFTTRDMKRRIVPVVKFSERFDVPYTDGNVGVVDTYFSCDFNSSPFIKGCIEYQIKLRTEELKAKWEIEKDLATRLENSLSLVNKASWLTRLKWLFSGVKVDV